MAYTRILMMLWALVVTIWLLIFACYQMADANARAIEGVHRAQALHDSQRDDASSAMNSLLGNAS